MTTSEAPLGMLSLAAFGLVLNGAPWAHALWFLTA
jgi:hypothetical protein